MSIKRFDLSRGEYLLTTVTKYHPSTDLVNTLASLRLFSSTSAKQPISRLSTPHRHHSSHPKPTLPHTLSVSTGNTIAHKAVMPFVPLVSFPFPFHPPSIANQANISPFLLHSWLPDKLPKLSSTNLARNAEPRRSALDDWSRTRYTHEELAVTGRSERSDRAWERERERERKRAEERARRG